MKYIPGADDLMAGPLDEGVAERGGRVHDGGDGVRHSVDDVVDLVEVDAAEVLLHKGLDRLGLTVGVEQRPRLHHSNSYYELHRGAQLVYDDSKLGRFLPSSSAFFLNCILSHHQAWAKGCPDEAQVRWDLTLRRDGA